MDSTYSNTSEAMLRSRAAAAETFRARVEAKLGLTGIPAAVFEPDEEQITVCTRSGYRISSYGANFASIGIFGRSAAVEAVRQGERDALMQQAREALSVESGDWFNVTINDYGHLRATEARTLRRMHEFAHEIVTSVETWGGDEAV